LKSHGITSACVAAGGDICVSNRPPGKTGWVISIAPLEKTGKITTQLLLENQAVSTSGDLEQYVEIDGVRYSHIVDTRTGLGLTTRMSCTVVAKNATDSDAAATAVCILGYEKGLKMINEHPEMACQLVVQEGETAKPFASTTWAKLVVNLQVK
jgi:FAD:protein FMN transferase